jgi:hypothetical protein
MRIFAFHCTCRTQQTLDMFCCEAVHCSCSALHLPRRPRNRPFAQGKLTARGANARLQVRFGVCGPLHKSTGAPGRPCSSVSSATTRCCTHILRMSQAVTPPKSRGRLATVAGTDLAGSTPMFPGLPGEKLAESLPIVDMRVKRLIFNRLRMPSQVHVYSAECVAGERLRVQMFVPVLPLGGAVVPAFALVAQSLPYSADVRKLPLELPAGFSAVVAPPPADLVHPVEDVLTRVRYYPGPVIDTRTLVGGRCYLVVWSPNNHVGKYVLQVGQRWPTRVGYWARLPGTWWQIRGWFGLSRAAAVYVAAAAAAVAATIALFVRRVSRGDEQA